MAAPLAEAPQYSEGDSQAKMMGQMAKVSNDLKDNASVIDSKRLPTHPFLVVATHEVLLYDSSRPEWKSEATCKKLTLNLIIKVCLSA
eukprot:5560485-Amphidinium_carterae.1